MFDKDLRDLLNKRKDLESYISTFSVDKLVDFINENQDYIEKENLKIYRITRLLSEEKQLNLISRIDDLDLDINEKRKILVTLQPTTKSKIDTTNLPREYVSAIDIQVSENHSNVDSFWKIIIDFNHDLEVYQGLDELIYLNPMQLQNIGKSKILKLCEICPQVKIKDNVGIYHSTVEEYIKGEAWIESVLQQINPEWSDIQKVARIDNVIGKKISYSPDFNTEVFDEDEARPLWKIICSGYGVCNGVAQVEEYMLGRIGVQADRVYGKEHTFLKLKNIEVQSKNGEPIKGDTILDPTWNLTAHRYGAFPNCFCKSYEEIREHDIRASDGKDLECHKNDEELESATIELDEQSLREVFTSIGLADRDGKFPIKTLIDESKAIDDLNLPAQQAIEKQLLLLSRYYPDFATCQNSTMEILTNILLNLEMQRHLYFFKCVVSRVHERVDKDKKPILYVYADLPDSGKKFYIPNYEEKSFLEVSQEDFETRFKCYEKDLISHNGYNPWEIEDGVLPTFKDSTKSSGSLVTSEEEDR